MLYHVTMEIKIPHDADEAKIAQIKSEERTRALALQKSGQWVHLWRVVGRYANVSVFDVRDHDELHTILSTLPLFPYMTITVTPLALHPSALRPTTTP